MNIKAIEFVKGLKPTDLPPGEEVLAKGREMGKEIKMRKSKFLTEHGYEHYHDYHMECARTGKPHFTVFMGCATLEEQIEATKKFHEFAKKQDVPWYQYCAIASPLMALPKEYREKAPKTTSFTMDEYEDWEALEADCPMEIFFEDHHLASPNAIDSTINALKAGSERVGLISQFIWAQPGYTDHRQHMIDFVTSIGMVSSKFDDYVSVDTYMDDGMPGYAMDCVTYVGYALLEHYLVRELCGARYQCSWGGLLYDVKPRMAIGVAIHKLLNKEDEPALGYCNGSTVYQWEDYVDCNYGPEVMEGVWQTLISRKYKMGLQNNCIAVTEKLRVPTPESLISAVGAVSRAVETIDQWEDMIDLTPIDELADKLAEEGKMFFENALDILEKAGINTKDPLEVFMVLKQINPSKFEGLFHHRADENGNVNPVVPTVLGLQTVDMQNRILEELHEKGLKGDELNGMKIALASGDGHSYGLLFMNNMLSEFGAEVVNGGVDVDPAVLLDIADEEGTNILAVSVHNGQCLDYSKQLMELIEKRDKDYHVILGGMLNAILPGESLPVDVTDLVRDTGVFGSNDLYEDITKLMEWK